MTQSTSQNPDLDWSQVRETVRMLNLAVAQIEMSMKEGDDSVDTLSNIFTSMVDRVQTIEKLTQQTKTEQDSQVLAQCQQVANDMQYAILAFQFYDKLTQRLSHVSHSLDSLGQLVGDNSRIYNPNEWSQLQQQIKSKYSMSAEHEMFEMVMQGMSIDEILKQAPKHDHSDDDGVELF
jgi:hypothetical protein